MSLWRWIWQQISSIVPLSYFHHANIDLQRLVHNASTKDRYKIKPGFLRNRTVFWKTHSKRGALLQSVLITHGPLLRDRCFSFCSSHARENPSAVRLWDDMRPNAEDVLYVCFYQTNPWNAFEFVLMLLNWMHLVEKAYLSARG